MPIFSLSSCTTYGSYHEMNPDHQTDLKLLFPMLSNNIKGSQT